MREVWGSGEERDGKLLGWNVERGLSVLKRFEESTSHSLGDGLEGLSSSTAWDPVPGAGLRPVHLHPPGVCIWERKWEISGVEASGGKCPW